MHRIAVPLAVVTCVTLLAGCNSEPSSQTYAADMDTTWAAALRVVRSMTGAEPEEASREQGRIVTKWAPVSKETIEAAPGTATEMDLLRGVVNLSPANQGTKVAVRFDRQVRQRKDPTSPGSQQEGNVMVPLKSDTDQWQKVFLDRLAAELGASTR